MFVQKEQIIFLCVLFVAIVVGNMAIFLSIVTSKSGKQSRMKYFIMHLAIAGSYIFPAHWFHVYRISSSAEPNQSPNAASHQSIGPVGTETEMCGC